MLGHRFPAVIGCEVGSRRGRCRRKVAFVSAFRPRNGGAPVVAFRCRQHERFCVPAYQFVGSSSNEGAMAVESWLRKPSHELAFDLVIASAVLGIALWVVSYSLVGLLFLLVVALLPTAYVSYRRRR